MNPITATDIQESWKEAEWRELNDPDDPAYKAREILNDAFFAPIVNRMEKIMDDFKKTEDTISEERDGFTVYSTGARRSGFFASDVGLRRASLKQCSVARRADRSGEIPRCNAQ